MKTMKTLTGKLSLFMVLSSLLFLSSCLDSGDQHYTGTFELSYITTGKTTGKIYAKTLSGYIITSPNMQTFASGKMGLISFQVKPNEDKQVTVDSDELGNNIVAYEVEMSSDIKYLKHTMLNPNLAPTDENNLKFENLGVPIFASNQYFGDLWVFSYTYKAKEGENIKANFYMASEEDAKDANCDVLIDIRLQKEGTADSGVSEKLEGDNIVVDLSYLRSMFADKTDSQGNINIKFRYYNYQKDEAQLSMRTYPMKIKNK